MRKFQRGFGAPDFAKAYLFVLAIGAGGGALVVWGVPMFWAWLKPLIHALTG